MLSSTNVAIYMDYVEKGVATPFLL